jgi:glycosyltransferase involved in cell wall biosynthesis
VRVLAVHSRYRSTGGEDVSFDTDVAYLRERGHEVRVLEVDSRVYAERGVRAQAFGLIGRDTDLESRIRAAAGGHQSDVAYLNNWFPWLAPYLEALGDLPVLATVPNYRLWCLNGLFFRSGHICRSCFSGTRLNGVRHSCYRGFTSSVVALGLVNKASKTLLSKPSVHFAPVSSFLADILIEAGVPSSRIHIKPNMVFPVPAVGGGGRSVLFAGRLEPEKGFDTFITACGIAGVTPVVAGTGSLGDLARARSDYRGALRPAEVEGLMGRSLVTVTPSIWDEPFGRVAAESLGSGTPVITSARGGLQSVGAADCAIVTKPGDPSSLSSAIRRVRSDAYWSGAARVAARARFMANFAPEVVGGLLEGALTATAADGPTAH